MQGQEQEKDRYEINIEYETDFVSCHMYSLYFLCSTRIHFPATKLTFRIHNIRWPCEFRIPGKSIPVTLLFLFFAPQTRYTWKNINSHML